MAEVPSGDHLLTDAVAELLRVGTERVRQMVEEGDLEPGHVQQGRDGRIVYAFHPRRSACNGKGTPIRDRAEALHELYLAHVEAGIQVPGWLTKWAEPPRWYVAQRFLDFGMALRRSAFTYGRRALDHGRG